MPRFSRQLVWIFLAVVIAQSGVVAAETAFPVATNIAGSVAVQTANGSTEEVSSTRILRSGEAVITGVDSSAIVSLADVARVLLGSGTTLTTFSDGTTLSLQLVSGEVCVQSSRPKVSVVAGSLSLLPTDPSTIYDLSYAQNRTELLVYRGGVATKVNGAGPTMVKAGTAAAILNSGAPRPADVSAVNADFSALHCPDPSIVAQVIPQVASTESTSSTHGGSFAGILGVLAGLGAIAAAVGHSGGGSTATTPPTTSGSPTPVPSPSILPTETPAPTPTPAPTASGDLFLSPSSLSFSAPLSPSQTFVARDHGTRSFSANSSDPLVAIVVEKNVHSHSATFSVSPVAPGTAMISVNDGADHSGNVSVTVDVGLSSAAQKPQAPLGQLVVQPKELVLSVGNRATFNVSEARYAGPFRITSSGFAADAMPSAGVGPTASFMMVGHAPGSATLTIADNHGETVTLQVSVRAR